jgi:hypothetical protein
MIDTITFWVFVAIWPVWLVWELVLLKMRASGPEKPRTISMVARDLGWRANMIVYLWAGLSTHYWWPGKAWSSVAGGVTFWLIALALLIEDLCLKKHPPAEWPTWLKWQRLPLVWLVIGLLAGHFLFPQWDVMFSKLVQ